MAPDARRGRLLVRQLPEEVPAAAAFHRILGPTRVPDPLLSAVGAGDRRP
jgi:hypothetical protein